MAEKRTRRREPLPQGIEKSKRSTCPRVAASVQLPFNRLKERLSKLGITQEDFGQAVGISFRQTNRIVLNQQAPSLLTAVAMAAVLGDTVENLFPVKVKVDNTA